MAVVKANAYGHGAVMVARAALDAGARWLAVATVDEGRQLRDAGIAAPILVLAPSAPEEAPAAVRCSLILAVADLPGAAAIAAAAGRSPAPVHVEIDTGLGRFGVHHTVAVETVARIAAMPGLRLDGLYTHFATADEAERSFYDRQQARFAAILDELAARGIAPPQIHQDNSAGSIVGPGARATLIRPGIALYGLSPSEEVPAPAALRPTLRLVTRVARVLDLALGESVSYGRTFVATRPTRAALVPLGYADGYRRALSGRAQMLLGGRRAPVLGRVCMDQAIIGVPDGAAVAVGDEVVAIGAQGDAAIGADELAALAGTIAYEIGTGIGARVPRHYLRGGRTVAIETLAGLRRYAE
jgi:alanine racemase